MNNTVLKIAIGGLTGRMGQALFDIINNKKELNFVISKEVRKNSFDLDFDIFIDFTCPEATMRYLECCLQHRKPMVIGTTGLSEDQIEIIQRAANEIPILVSANFSIGINVLLTVLHHVTHAMGNECDIEIIETHHRHKVDAPSGTALAMGETIARARGQELEHCAIYERCSKTETRLEGSIGFTSIRAGDIVGEHTALFATDTERLEISHKASSRHTFALGALKAARWLVGKPAGLYNMKDVLNLM